MDEKINLDDLYQTQKNIEDNKIKKYQKILSRVHKKIKVTSKNRNCDKFCFFVVPEFVLGIPRYDISTCITYVIDKLIDNGFQVRYTHPNLLFISWNHYIPYHTRLDIKKRTGIKVDGFGNTISKKNNNNNNDDDPSNINSLIFKKNEKINVGSKNKDKNKNYKSIQSYKPTGNLIYSKELLEKISGSLNNN